MGIMLNPREIVYGVVLDFDGVQVLATADAAVIVGKHTDMHKVFGGLLAAYVPIDAANSSIKLIDIRAHAPGMFKD